LGSALGEVTVFRFLHAADVHLDSRLVGLSAYQGAPVELLRTATRRAFSALIDRALDERVDFVVIAGDLYDGDWRDFNTGLYFVGEMRRLAQAGVPVFVAHGNHDADSEITRQLTLPENVTVFAARKPQTCRLDALRVALHGQSFREAATTDNLAVGYPDAVSGWFNVGVLHTAMEGHAAHASYAPCALAELQAKGYDYWALGHVHEHRIVCQAPWVVYPGNLQGRSVRELGPRGAVLVEVEEGEVTVQRLLVDAVRWHHLELDVSGAGTLADVLTRAAAALEELAADPTRRGPVAVRLTLVGAAAAHGELFGDEARLRAELIALASGFGDETLWLEKVRVRTTPALDAAAIKARADAVAELQILLERAETDEAFLAELTGELSELATRAPQLLLERVPELTLVR
jgi:DNA repair exonuclease SbcCD nuclease subunit